MILRKRDNDCLPTIISSNYNINEIETEYNIDVKDFIIQNDEIVYIAGDNHRIEKQDSFEEF
jgi:DNA replication protein DnaC